MWEDRWAYVQKEKLFIFQRPVISEMYANEGSDLILGRSNIFSFFEVSRLALRPTEPPMLWTSEALSPGVERWFRQNDHSTPSIAQVSNECWHTSLPLYMPPWRGALPLHLALLQFNIILNIIRLRDNILNIYLWPISGTLTQSRKQTISFVYVRMSICQHVSAPSYLTHFH